MAERNDGTGERRDGYGLVGGKSDGRSTPYGLALTVRTDTAASRAEARRVLRQLG